MTLQQDIALSLHSIGAVKFGDFTLKSGIQSPIYIDLRLLISYPALLQKIAEAMSEKAKTLTFDLIAGIPYTALPIATAMSLQNQWPMVYARKEVKDYGTKKKIEGVYQEGQTALVIDDLITSGASKFETIEPFESAGLKITDFIVLIDRQQGGKKTLETKGYHLHSLITLAELLDILLVRQKIDSATHSAVLSFLQEHTV